MISRGDSLFVKEAPQPSTSPGIQDLLATCKRCVETPDAVASSHVEAWASDCSDKAKPAELGARSRSSSSFPSQTACRGSMHALDTAPLIGLRAGLEQGTGQA